MSSRQESASEDGHPFGSARWIKMVPFEPTSRLADHLAAAGEVTKAPALVGVAAHRVRVDAQGEGRVGEAELAHHRDGVLADREEKRGEGVAERVRSDPRRHRKLQDGAQARLHQLSAAGRLNGIAMPYLGQQDRTLPYLPADLVPRDEVVVYPTNFSPMPQAKLDQLSRRGEQLTHLAMDRWPVGQALRLDTMIELLRRHASRRRSPESGKRRSTS
jgi:hypothetical protein